MRVTINGQEHASWVPRRGANRTRQSETHTLLRHIINLDSKFSEQHLEAMSEGIAFGTGTYTYSFSFRLPGNEQLPGSLEADFGHIRYWVKAMVAVPWTRNTEAIQPIVVVPVVDCNYKGYLQADSRKVSTMTSCGCFTVKSDIEAYIGVPRLAYVAGEIINCEVKIKNNSRITVQAYVVNVVQVTEYKTGLSKTTSRRVHSTKTIMCQIPPFSPVRLEQIVTLPALIFGMVPPTILNAHIMTNTFVVELVVVKTRFVGDRVSVSVPIVIGTIPYVPNYSPEKVSAAPELALSGAQTITHPSSAIASAIL
jgi:hypothetical protein